MKSSKLIIVFTIFSSFVGTAAGGQWTPYLGADVGIVKVKSFTIDDIYHDLGINRVDAPDTIRFQFNTGPSIGLEGGVNKGNLTLGLQLHSSRLDCSEAQLVAQNGNPVSEPAVAARGKLKLSTLAPTVGYKFYTKGKFSMGGKLTIGVMRRDLTGLQNATTGQNAGVDFSATTWLIEPALMVRYDLGKHSSLNIRYGYTFSGKTNETVADKSSNRGDYDYFDFDGIQFQSLSFGYTFQF